MPNFVYLVTFALVIVCASAQTYYRDCQETKDHYVGNFQSGQYRIQPYGSPCSFYIYCEYDGTHVYDRIQRRYDGSVGFDHSWVGYKNGFGDNNGGNKEHWLGNDKIYYLTNQASYEIVFEMWNYNNVYAYARYDHFYTDKNDYYRSNFGDYKSGSNAGDSIHGGSQSHNNKRFSTKDKDNDGHSDSCSKLHGGSGGWWFDGSSGCDMSNLNGRYGDCGCSSCSWASTNDHCIEWNSFPHNVYPMKKTTIKLWRKTKFGCA